MNCPSPDAYLARPYDIEGDEPAPDADDVLRAECRADRIAVLRWLELQERREAEGGER